MSLATILLFGNNGVITKQVLGGLIDFKIYGFRGLTLVETMAYFPTAYLVMAGILQAIDPALEDAAFDLGASRWRVFRTVTLPLAIPGLASALLLLFIESLADFGNPMILSGNFQVLAVQAYLRITGLYDLAGGSALAIILLIPSLIAFLLQKYWVGRRSYVTVTGKPSQGRKRDTPALRWGAFAVCLGLTGIIALFLRHGPGGLLRHALGSQLSSYAGQLSSRLRRRLGVHQGYHLPVQRGDADYRACSG